MNKPSGGLLFYLGKKLHCHYNIIFPVNLSWFLKYFRIRIKLF